MKTNYLTFSNVLRVSILSISVLVASSVLVAQTVETTVFADDFNREVLSGGVPSTTYTILKQAGSGDDASDPTTTTTVNVIRIPNRKGSGYWGRNGVFGDLSVYKSPFTSKLSTTDVDSIVWTFNMRQNYNSTLSGFDDSQNGVGAILLSDAANYASGNGYAVIYGEAAVGKKYRLVKFTGGVDANSNLTTIALGDVSPTDGRDYMSFRVVYVKNTNNWTLYGRFDGPNTGGAFANPSQGTFDYKVSAVNSDLDNTEMINFGFFQNYSGNIDKIMWVDNYIVKTYVSDLGTGIKAQSKQKFYKLSIVDNEILIDTFDAKVNLYNLDGVIVNSTNINGIGKFKVSNNGFYILKIESNKGEVEVEKIIIR